MTKFNIVNEFWYCEYVADDILFYGRNSPNLVNAMFKCDFYFHVDGEQILHFLKLSKNLKTLMLLEYISEERLKCLHEKVATNKWKIECLANKTREGGVELRQKA